MYKQFTDLKCAYIHDYGFELGSTAQYGVSWA